LTYINLSITGQISLLEKEENTLRKPIRKTLGESGLRTKHPKKAL